MGQYAFECGFLHHIVGTKEKHRKNEADIFHVLFCCSKNFSTFFLKAQQIAVAWVATVRKGGMRENSPRLLSRRKEVKNYEVIFFPTGYSSTV